ncbi:DUF4394 domain-containing protein [Streptomyces sp. NPDC048330]|uniref:DUF4394 domain-containing protein n=1 Tax=Streptomyces sp. NPDC048330 TaxID=3365533 RepID=UPI00371B70DA
MTRADQPETRASGTVAASAAESRSKPLPREPRPAPSPIRHLSGFSADTHPLMRRQRRSCELTFHLHTFSREHHAHAYNALILGSLAAAEARSAPAVAIADGGPRDMHHTGHRSLNVLGLTSDQLLVDCTVDGTGKALPWARSPACQEARLVGIDFRAQNEKLRGVGVRGGTYTLNTTNAKAMKVSQPTGTLSGKAVRCGLQSGREPGARHLQHRAEPASQHRRRRCPAA